MSDSSTITSHDFVISGRGSPRALFWHAPCPKKIVDEPPPARPESPHHPQVANLQEDALS
jgi:hypothetical protein